MQSSFFLHRHPNKGTKPLFEIHAIEQQQQSWLEKLDQEHLLDHFKLAWIQQGRGIQIINQEQYILEANQIHFAVPGQQHRLLIDHHSKGFIISFNEAFLNSCYEDFNGMQETTFFRMYSQKKALHIQQAAADMEELALKLLKENENQYLLKNEVLSKYLKIFLIYVRRQCKTTEPLVKNNSHLFNNFISLLENNYKEKKAVAEYASELSVTPSYLNHVIKKTSGYPASYHIQQRIVLEAKRKVRYTGASMKEVAYYLGFDDMAHFSKFFKSSSGMNFTAFKNSSREARA